MRKKQRKKPPRDNTLSDTQRDELALIEEQAERDFACYRKKATRKVFWREAVDRGMRTFSECGVPTPKVLLDFNRALWPVGRAPVKKESRNDEARALLTAYLESGKNLSDRQLAKLVGVSRPTIAEWRTERGIDEFLEKLNTSRTPIVVPTVKIKPGAPTETQRVIPTRFEISHHSDLRLRRLALLEGVTVTSLVKRIILSSLLDGERRLKTPRGLPIARN